MAEQQQDEHGFPYYKEGRSQRHIALARFNELDVSILHRTYMVHGTISTTCRRQGVALRMRRMANVTSLGIQIKSIVVPLMVYFHRMVKQREQQLYEYNAMHQ